MSASREPRWLLWLLPVITGAAVVGIWAFVTAVFEIRHFILPSPVQVVEAAWNERAVLCRSASITLVSAVIGFVSSGVIGGAWALVLSSSRWVRAAIYPLVLVVQMFPIVVMGPLFVIWFGWGLHSVSMLAFVIGFFPVVANATQGLISTDRNMVDLFKTAGARWWQEFLFLRVPFALPYYLTGLKIAASLAMIGSLTGEIFAGSYAGGEGGLGFRVFIYFGLLKTAAVIATGFTACFCGFLFVGSVHFLNWLLLRRWHESMAPREA